MTGVLAVCVRVRAVVLVGSEWGGGFVLSLPLKAFDLLHLQGSGCAGLVF